MKISNSFLLTLSAISIISTTQCTDFKTFKKASFPAKSTMCGAAYLVVGIPAIVTTAVLPPNRIPSKILTGIGITCLAPFASIDIMYDEVKKGIKYGSTVKNITREVAKASGPALIGLVAFPCALHKYLADTPTDISIAHSDELLEAKDATQS